MTISFIRPSVYSLIGSIKHDPQWRQTQYTFHNSLLKTHIWTGNGLFFIDVYPGSGAFNIIEKWVIKQTINERNIINALKEKTNVDN